MTVSRRQALKLLGGTLLLGACSNDKAGDPEPEQSQPNAFDNAASCTLTPTQTAGPFYIDVDSLRSDIREDRQGTRLDVAVRVVDADGCTPRRDAVVELWHCDADGDYSGFGDAPRPSRWLRGAQLTNADGVATITTIYPGWYQGRAVHIHAKVLLDNNEALTTQFYFDDAVSREVYKAAPYSRRGAYDTSNADDRIYRRDTTLTTAKEGDGYVGRITVGVKA